MTDDVAVSTEIQVDDETRAALLLFNERVEANAAKERGRKRVAKAERAKADAAKKVRRVNDDPNATAEQKAEAEAEYKAASDSFQVLQANPLASEKKPAKAEQPPAEEVSAEQATEPAAEAPSEVSADEESSNEQAPAAEEPQSAEAPAESE